MLTVMQEDSRSVENAAELLLSQTDLPWDSLSLFY